MLSQERHRLILNQLSLNNKVVVADLCTLLKVSLDTVRRDLRELEKNGKLVKVHGGAVGPDFHYPFQQPDVYARDEKKVIAKKALGLIRDGMTFLAGGGTAMLELARMFPQKLTGTFFTVSPLVALEVTQRSTIDVILLAGRLLPDSYICTGASVIAQLGEIKVDLCLMGTNSLSRKEGVTENSWEVTQVKKAMLKSSSRTALLCLSEKVDTTQKMQVCKASEIDCLITETSPVDPRIKPFGKLVSKIL